MWKYIKISRDCTTQLCNLLPPTTVSRFVAIDAKRQKLATPVHRIIDVDDDDGTHDFVSVAAAGPGSPNTSAVAGVSAMTPAKTTSENLSAVVDSHLLLETGKNLNFDVQGGAEKNTREESVQTPWMLPQ